MNVAEQIIRGESDVKIARDMAKEELDSFTQKRVKPQGRDMAKEELDRCNRYRDYAEYQALKDRYYKLVFAYCEQSHRGVAQ